MTFSRSIARFSCDRRGNIAVIFALVLVPLISAIGWGGFALILGGGIFYTIGAILYGKGREKPFMHCVFHVFVILGSICHILAILLFAL